jgi:hypothetical protein
MRLKILDAFLEEVLDFVHFPKTKLAKGRMASVSGLDVRREESTDA